MIDNIEVYMRGLDKGLQDKMFFLNKIDVNDYEVVIDFGSGNGNLLNAIREAFNPYVDLIGIEKNVSLIIASRNKTEGSNVRFYETFDTEYLKDKKTLLILSSVLHELDYEGLKELGDYLRVSDTVIIRDMQKPRGTRKNVKDVCEKVREVLPDYMVKDFEEVHGKIDNKTNLYHILLKYTYVENWKHEVKENYFRAKNILTINFEGEIRDFYISYEENFMLPHQVKQIKSKFGYVLDETTHFKMILNRYNEKKEGKSDYGINN